MLTLILTLPVFLRDDIWSASRFKTLLKPSIQFETSGCNLLGTLLRGRSSWIIVLLEHRLEYGIQHPDGLLPGQTGTRASCYKPATIAGGVMN